MSIDYSSPYPICLKCIHSRVQSDIQTLSNVEQFQALMASRCNKSISIEVKLVIGQESMDTCMSSRMNEDQCGITGKWYEEPIQSEMENPNSEPDTSNIIPLTRIDNNSP
jgi:hypothetical protein